MHVPRPAKNCPANIGSGNGPQLLTLPLALARSYIGSKGTTVQVFTSGRYSVRTLRYISINVIQNKKSVYVVTIYGGKKELMGYWFLFFFFFFLFTKAGKHTSDEAPTSSYIEYPALA